MSENFYENIIILIQPATNPTLRVQDHPLKLDCGILNNILSSPLKSFRI